MLMEILIVMQSENEMLNGSRSFWGMRIRVGMQLTVGIHGSTSKHCNQHVLTIDSHSINFFCSYSYDFFS